MEQPILNQIESDTKLNGNFNWTYLCSFVLYGRDRKEAQTN